MSVVVKTDPVLEAIARKLSGIAAVPHTEQERMIRRAAKAGRDALLAALSSAANKNERELREAEGVE